MNKKKIYRTLAFFLCFILVLTSAPITKSFADTSASTPSFTITRTLDKSSYVEGDTATITYKVTPTGYITGVVRNPADITLMLDISGSMNDKVWVSTSKGGSYSTKLRLMKDAAKAFVDNIATVNAKESDVNKDRISVIFFETEVSKKASILSFTSDYASVKSSIEACSANWYDNYHGGTNYDEALRKAKDVFTSSANRSKVAVFFSDGKPTHYSSKLTYAWTGEYVWRHYWFGGWYREKVYGTTVSSDYDYPERESYNDSVNTISKMAAMRSLKDLHSTNVTIYTVGLGNGNGTSGIDYQLLTDMATAGGGRAYQSENAAGLNDFFKKIADSIKTASIENISIVDNLPDTAQILPDQPNVTPSEDGTKFTIQVPTIEFNKINVTPPSITFTVKIKFPVPGKFELKGGVIYYKDINNISQTMGIGDLSVTVGSAIPLTAPTFSVSPTTPTKDSVKVTINFPEDSDPASRMYKVVYYGEDKTQCTFIPYTGTPITIDKESSIDKPTMIYAVYSDQKQKPSAEGSVAITNVDKTAPTEPIINVDGSSLSSDSVSVSVLYPSDATVKEYRINDSTTWTSYTKAFDVIPVNTTVYARATDAAGNVSTIASKVVSMFSSIDFKFDGGKLQTSVMRKGTLIANLIFKTTGNGIPRFILTNGDENSKTLLAKLELKNATLKDAFGKPYTIVKDSMGNSYTVTKDNYTNEITVVGTKEISTNGTELSLKLVLGIKSDTPYNAKGEFYKLMLKDTKSILEVRVVRNPKLY